MTAPILDIADLAERVAAERARGRRIVTTNGVFDLLHKGHRFLFDQCRKLGDVLVVGVNSDSSVRALKGNHRPFQSHALRAQKVAAFADYVFVFDEYDPGDALRILKPDVHVTAASYGPDCPEASAVREIGAELALVPVHSNLGSSTSRIQKRRRRRELSWSWTTHAASPLLRLCSVVRRTRRRVLFIPLSGIGDGIQLTPLLRAVNESDPAVEVDILWSGSRLPLFAGNPHVNRVDHASDKGRFALIAHVWRRRYGAVVCLHPRTLFLTMGLWACAPTRITAIASPTVSRRFATTFLPHVRGTSRFAMYTSIAALLGAELADDRPEFPVSSGAESAAVEWLDGHMLVPRTFVVINPSAFNRAKEWPIEHWEALLLLVTSRLGCHVVVSTDNASVAQRLAATGGARVVDASGLTLEQAAAVYARAGCYVSADTGPLYIAHAMGTPLVVIVGISYPDENIPHRRSSVVHVAPPPGIQPWDTKTLPARALVDTPPEAVYEAIASLLTFPEGVREDAYGDAPK